MMAYEQIVTFMDWVMSIDQAWAGIGVIMSVSTLGAVVVVGLVLLLFKALGSKIVTALVIGGVLTFFAWAWWIALT